MTPGAQDARNTYNIWVPSPKSDPNKIENMRTIVTGSSKLTGVGLSSGYLT